MLHCAPPTRAPAPEKRRFSCAQATLTHPRIIPCPSPVRPTARTILPEAKMRAVLLGSRMRMMTAAKRLGLYSAFLACSAIFFRSSLQSRFTVATTFCDGEGGDQGPLADRSRPGAQAGAGPRRSVPTVRRQDQSLAGFRPHPCNDAIERCDQAAARHEPLAPPGAAARCRWGARRGPPAPRPRLPAPRCSAPLPCSGDCVNAPRAVLQLAHASEFI